MSEPQDIVTTRHIGEQPTPDSPPTTLLTWLPGGAQGAFPVFPIIYTRLLIADWKFNCWRLQVMTTHKPDDDSRGWVRDFWESISWYAVLDVDLPVPGKGE